MRFYPGLASAPCSHFLHEGPDESPADGERFHHQDEVPIHQGTVGIRMPFLHVQEGVRDGSSEDGDVGQRHGILRAEVEHEDVDGHENAAPADAPCGRDQEPQRAQGDR